MLAASFPLGLWRLVAWLCHRARPCIVEATPAYEFLASWVAPHIQRLVPGAKAVVVLRDPVERAKSLHAFGVQLGWETLDLEDALEAETSRQPWERLYAACEAAGHSGPIVHNEHVAFHTYAARGTYSGLAALVGAFGVQNVFICSLDELSADDGPLLRLPRPRADRSPVGDQERDGATEGGARRRRRA